MTIHELLAAAGLTANDEIPIWDAEATGEPTKKITAQQLAAAVVALANLVTSVNNQTGAVSITPSNIGAVAKTGDTMTGRLEMSLDANSAQDRITFSCPNVVGPMQLVANATGTQQRVTFRQYTPDGMSFEEYALPNTADYADGPALRNILTDKSPVTIPQGGTNATTWDGARENLGIIARHETVPFGSDGVGTINTPNGFTPFAAVFDQNWFITVHPPNKIIARRVSDYNTLIHDTTISISVLYAKLA